jgi:hypothetical protein
VGWKRPDFAALAEVQEQVRGRCQEWSNFSKKIQLFTNGAEPYTMQSEAFETFRHTLRSDQNVGAKVGEIDYITDLQ